MPDSMVNQFSDIPFWIQERDPERPWLSDRIFPRDLWLYVQRMVSAYPTPAMRWMDLLLLEPVIMRHIHRNRERGTLL